MSLATYRIILPNLANTTLRSRVLLSKRCPCLKDWPCGGLQHRIAARQFADAMYETFPKYGANLQSEAPPEPAKEQFRGNKHCWTALCAPRAS
jgi:hypothetical protein